MHAAPHQNFSLQFLHTVGHSNRGPTVAHSDRGPTVAHSDRGPTVAHSDRGPTVAHSDRGLLFLTINIPANPFDRWYPGSRLPVLYIPRGETQWVGVAGVSVFRVCVSLSPHFRWRHYYMEDGRHGDRVPSCCTVFPEPDYNWALSVYLLGALSCLNYLRHASPARRLKMYFNVCGIPCWWEETGKRKKRQTNCLWVPQREKSSQTQYLFLFIFLFFILHGGDFSISPSFAR